MFLGHAQRVAAWKPRVGWLEVHPRLEILTLITHQTPPGITSQQRLSGSVYERFGINVSLLFLHRSCRLKHM